MCIQKAKHELFEVARRQGVELAAQRIQVVAEGPTPELGPIEAQAAMPRHSPESILEGRRQGDSQSRRLLVLWELGEPVKAATALDEIADVVHQEPVKRLYVESQIDRLRMGEPVEQMLDAQSARRHVLGPGQLACANRRSSDALELKPNSDLPQLAVVSRG